MYGTRLVSLQLQHFGLHSQFCTKRTKIVATTRFTGSKYNCGRQSVPDSARGAYSTPPDPQLELMWPLRSRERMADWTGRRERRGRMERGGIKRKGRPLTLLIPFKNSYGCPHLLKLVGNRTFRSQDVSFRGMKRLGLYGRFVRWTFRSQDDSTRERIVHG